MELTYRQARETDFRETENLTREAFWDLYKPGCNEHLVLHRIRNSGCYLPELDLVAVEGDQIIGHIICTKAKVIDPENREHQVVCAGPFSVIKDRQGKGTGTGLMDHCIERARESGHAGMILFGNPGYYHRFGFRNAADFGIQTKEGMNFEPFMAMELQKDGLTGIRGKFYEDDSYAPGEEELEEFEKHFPHKEKHITTTQLKM